MKKIILILLFMLLLLSACGKTKIDNVENHEYDASVEVEPVNLSPNQEKLGEF